MPKLSLRSRTRPCLSSGTNWPTRSSGYPDRRGAVSERLKKEAHGEVGEEGAGTPRNSTRVTEAGGTTAPFLLELLFGVEEMEETLHTPSTSGRVNGFFGPHAAIKSLHMLMSPLDCRADVVMEGVS